jgi:perosamine synthetase
MNIPLSKPDITELDIEAVLSVLRSTRLSLGPRMEEFELRVANYIGVPHAVAVSSGTAGLHLCLLALGIGEGDEVIVPSFTFIAAANVIRYVRATPVFVDIDPISLNLNPALVEQAITPATRAIIAVHNFGRPAEMNALQAIARRHNLLLIEDACEAIGAEYHDQKAGSFGDAAVFAFYPNKQITTGEGGIVVTRDPALAREIRALRNHGRYDADDWHQHSILGYNYRLSELNCALGCTQMQRLESILAKREAVAQNYNRQLATNPSIIIPAAAASNTRVSWFVYTIRLAPHFSRNQRDALLISMQNQGIQCGRYFAPIHTQPAYSEIPIRSQLPITISESDRAVALPFFTELSTEEVRTVSEALLSALRLLQ